jgi:hypothetical protein
MSRRRPAHIAALLFLGACTLVKPARADELPAYSITNRTAVKTTIRNGETVGLNQIRRAYVTVGTNQFMFIVPAGFQLDASNPRKIVLTDTDCSCFIVLRFDSSTSADAVGQGPDSWRRLALSRFPGATILNEFAEFAADHSGQAFDLRWRNSGGAEQSARVVFIPSPVGMLEFSVLANSNRFEDSRSSFSSILGSLRSNECGKIEITPLSGTT